jgi:hypothetical protein
MVPKSLVLFLCLTPAAYGAQIRADLSGVKPGPIAVSATSTALQVDWHDSAGQPWEAIFSLDSTKPLITSFAINGKIVVQGARPIYRVATGKRKGGWDAFFDFPPADPDGTRQFLQQFHPTVVHVSTVGNRVEVSFNGMQLGIFSGEIRYDFYPGTSLIQQVAVLSTQEPDTAYYYDAGLQMASPQDVRPGGNMEPAIDYYDAHGAFQTVTPVYGSERHTLQVHYRAVAARMGVGSIAVFPSPHRYLFARDYTTNMGYSWYSSWRGQVGLGIQQPPDDNTGIYPWMNAAPNTQQEMGIFILLGSADAATTLKAVTRYTHEDRFENLPGYVTFAPHWHFAFTVQALANGPSWVPPFKPELEATGVDAAMIMDFHLDGHPADLTDIRFKELADYYRLCKAQSDKNFMLVPSEEADVILGGHWGLVFPKPVLWHMDRKEGEPFKTVDPKFGTVYRVHTTEEMWRMVTDEGGYAYQTHPRTKGSTGYPDKILNTDYFKSSRYIGVGWKAMPSDLSSPRLGDRAFKVLDELNNMSLHKLAVGEDDVFQLARTDELYAHMNINYLKLDHLPDFDHYGDLLQSLVRGDGFISTGEVLLPAFAIRPEGSDGIHVEADVSSTFPLRFAEIVWGDGTLTHREIVDLQTTKEFDRQHYSWTAKAPGWTWARFAVWDVAADGAFSNPVWKH